MVSEIFEGATLFFRADGSFILENHYAELMVKVRKSFSTAAEESLRTEIVYGTYEISMQAGENGTYPITATKEDGSTLEFRFSPKAEQSQANRFSQPKFMKERRMRLCLKRRSQII